MKNKIKLGILFGGRSAEHEISIISAKNIIEAIDKEKYEITYLFIDKNGTWHSNRDMEKIVGEILLANEIESKFEVKNNDIINISFNTNLDNVLESESIRNLDAIFPVLHGPFGEDGTVQGLFKLLGIPFVGCSVLSSAVCMDKDFTKKILRDAGVKINKFLTYHSYEKEKINFETVEKELGLPVFIKPVNLGSSVGISKVYTKEEFDNAIKEAFEYDRKIIIEEMTHGREIECAVLGNDEIIASIPGEVVLNDDFYSYDTKYLDENGAKIVIPASLTENEVKRLKEVAIKSYRALECEGLSRVDMFLTPEGDIYVNELNTMPGFTNISMYPKLFEASGIKYNDLIDKLIMLALNRSNEEKKLSNKKVF